MATRMLIDASYPEETRVAVIKGKRLEEFDFETASKKPLKGNIYLAKVTRVEPSLQAAFVDYGGNRHGFLAFSEIHPDYYQIPIEDREALIAQERAEEVESAEAEEQAADAEAEHADKDDGASEGDGDAADAEAVGASDADEGEDAQASSDPAGDEEADESDEAAAQSDGDDDAESGDDKVDAVGGDAYDEVDRPRRAHRRHYKIQEVIKRRQILLVQVVKEERGNKGAALTTYMSLAGRYCVLMPNTGRGGGISRKITSPNDRKRLKTIAKDLDVPDGMGVIVRTAGMSRNKSEIKRDFEYLLRIWDQIRELTLQSTAPCLVYEEANQIKRAIRDLYNKDIEEIQIEGEEGYRTAKDFMRMLMPSHAKRVQPYKDRIPLFHRYQIEQQLDAMYSPVVTLPSGGYIVINSTEALVAIDVNSGKSTKEHNIEETALKTNTEAAEETARQLRLRDLAGLIVIDFIDMEVNRNNRAVERKLKECLKADRARIQVGRISAFGLLEMSRQRLRPGVHEVNMETCGHCAGTGVVRSTDSTALHVLRAIEEEGIRDRSDAISVYVPASVAFYILNQKRQALTEIESRYGFSVMLEPDDTLIPPDHRIERLRNRTAEGKATAKPIQAGTGDMDAVVDEPEEKPEDRLGGPEQDGDQEEAKGKRRRRRRRRKKPDDAVATQAETVDAEADSVEPEAEATAEADEDGESAEADDDAGEESIAQKRRRRGRRGGRRRTRRRDDEGAEEAVAGDAIEQPDEAEPAPEAAEPLAAEASAEPRAAEEPETPEPTVESEDQPAEPVAAAAEEPAPAEESTETPAGPEEEPAAAEPEVIPLAAANDPTDVEAAWAVSEPEPEAPQQDNETVEEPAAEEKPRRRGWWSRRG